MSTSSELYIEHVIEGNLSLPKNSCFRALPIYWPVRNFNILVLCAFVIVGLCQNAFDSSLSISRFVVHLLMLGNWFDMITILFFWSCLVRYVCRHLT